MDKDLLHRYLDDELSAEEKKRFLDELNSDPQMKSELDDLLSVVNIVETDERLTVPPGFTSEVMKRLPASKVPFTKRVSGFLFGQRVLRWNIATALAALCLMIIALGGLLLVQKKGNVVSYQSSFEKATRTVAISFYAPQARKVSLAGDFNKWSIETGLMKKESNGIWTLEVSLQPGTYHYMFIVDGEVWVTDPNAESYRDDGFGNKNSVLRVSL